MITGANQMEGVILVVAATDGVQVQTREHVILAKEIGIPYMVVFINKVDAVKEKSMGELVELEVRELIESYGFSSDTPFIHGSAKKALEGDDYYLDIIKNMMNIVDDYIKDPKRNLTDSFLMPVETILVAQGRGTVVTGKVEKGQVKIGDELEVIGPKQLFKTVCMGLEMYHKLLDFAQAGDNVGILLKGVPNQEVFKGFVVCKPNTLRVYDTFIAKIYVLSAKEGGRLKPFKTGYRPQFFFRVSNITGTVNLETEETLAMPGENLTIKVVLFEKSILNIGLRFVIREGKLTVGAGIITTLVS
jgi:elongation factor Tu